MKKNRNFFNKNFISAVVLVGVLAAGVTTLFWAVNEKEEIRKMTFSELIAASDSSSIKDASIRRDGVVEGSLHDGVKFVSKIVMPSEIFVTSLAKNGANVKFEEPQHSNWLSNLLTGLIIAFILFLFFLLFSLLRSFTGYQGGGGGKMFNVGRSPAKFFPPDAIKTKFSDVAGLEEVKADLEDVIDFLKNPEKYKAIGAKIPRGVLLEGAPGNGKTLLAKAVAGEASCSFMTISGSDFVEVFVGVGASRVRDLFAQARRHAPCILFVDEIDAVGKKRHNSYGGGSEERDQTLNQMLTEMDGFSTEAGSVIVLAATNRVDMLDDALTRPGRFDRTVKVPFPDFGARRKILEVHVKNIKVDESVDLDSLARQTIAFSGADLANLVNEAALNAVKRSALAASMKDFLSAEEKISLGAPRLAMVRDKQELWETAVHEAGHTLLNILQDPAHTMPLRQVTIVARGEGCMGLTAYTPEKEKDWKRDSYFSWMVSAFGGLLAEKIVLGTQTSGVGSDIYKVSNMARNMVMRYGMTSDVVPIYYDLGSSWGRGRESEWGPQTNDMLDNEIRKVAKDAYDKGEELLKANVDKIEKLAHALVEKETLSAQEVYELFEMPVREPRKIEERVLGQKNEASS